MNNERDCLEKDEYGSGRGKRIARGSYTEGVAEYMQELVEGRVEWLDRRVAFESVPVPMDSELRVVTVQRDGYKIRFAKYTGVIDEMEVPVSARKGMIINNGTDKEGLR